MDIYNYKKIETVYAYGSIDKSLDKFIKEITSKLKYYKKTQHPKEIERQERLTDDLLPHPRVLRRPKMPSRSSSNAFFNDSLIIVCGNCGIGIKSKEYFDEKFNILNESLIENNCHILFIRGNNDCPELFNENRIDFSNVKTIPDYSLVQLKNFNCLCIGGNISIDREWKIIQEKRINKKSYWDNEATVLNEHIIEEMSKEFNISCVFTSSCPSFIYPGTNYYYNNVWVKNNPKILDALKEEKSTMDKIYNALLNCDNKPFVWCYENNDVYNGDSFNVNDISFIPLMAYNNISINEIMTTKYGLNLNEPLGKNVKTSNDDSSYVKKLFDKSGIYTTSLNQIQFRANDFMDADMDVDEAGVAEDDVDGVAEENLNEVAEALVGDNPWD